ncbi:hypothetical protein An16g03270 [Aspergillus niger]|uniref:Uncharacterized protein n=2 Tax=Aspergillus niger TaxID=5061 RepID=A2R7E8_ASPNC|nr:hypothetical protein An16g03270 [Aspergillus niger]CAK42826.1 hypothetical protein An16g03270 [Aspergillus niger]
MSGKAEHLMRGERQSGRERSSEETTCDGGQTVDQDPQHGDPSVAISFVYCLEVKQLVVVPSPTTESFSGCLCLFCTEPFRSAVSINREPVVHDKITDLPD